MSSLRCLRCGHFPAAHGVRGGACNYETYTCERRVSDDGIEITEDVTLCECPYLLAGA